MRAAAGSGSRAAFHAIGTHFTRPSVVVEDDLARAVVEYALTGESYASALEVMVRPGGASDYWITYLPDWAARDVDNVLLYLGGDQTCSAEVGHGHGLGTAGGGGERPQRERTAAGPRRGAGGPAHDAQKVAALRSVLRWRDENVSFLPFPDPETNLWPFRDGGSSDPKLPPGLSAKLAWDDHAKSTLGGRAAPRSPEILTLQRQALSKVSSSAPELEAIRTRVATFFGRLPGMRHVATRACASPATPGGN